MLPRDVLIVISREKYACAALKRTALTLPAVSAGKRIQVKEEQLHAAYGDRPFSAGMNAKGEDFSMR